MSKSQLISVSYISKATQDMGVLALMRLTDQAAQLNQKLGLSGVLFYENQHFGQILEGPSYGGHENMGKNSARSSPSASALIEAGGHSRKKFSRLVNALLLGKGNYCKDAKPH